METKFSLLIIFAGFNVISCNTQSPQVYQGGVYVSDALLKDKTIEYDSVYPILSMRVDSVLSNKLLVKYRFGREASMDKDFTYDASCLCYESIGKVKFAPFGSFSEKVSLKVINPKELELFYFNKGTKKSFLYRFTYVDEVDLTTHRNIYYAEDGYKLFKE